MNNLDKKHIVIIDTGSIFTYYYQILLFLAEWSKKCTRLMINLNTQNLNFTDHKFIRLPLQTCFICSYYTIIRRRLIMTKLLFLKGEGVPKGKKCLFFTNLEADLEFYVCRCYIVHFCDSKWQSLV